MKKIKKAFDYLSSCCLVKCYKKNKKTIDYYVNNYYFGFIFLIFVVMFFSFKWELVALSFLFAFVVNSFYVQQVKREKKNYFLFITLIIICFCILSFFCNYHIWISKALLFFFNCENIVKSYSVIHSLDESGNIDTQIYLFNQYSWYISLIITLLGAVATVIMYYNWRSNYKIREEWEKLRGKTLRKETELNESFQNIRDEVINDPDLTDQEDQYNLEVFAKYFREFQVDNALKYAFTAKEIQPKIREKAAYSPQEINDWESALQYWSLAMQIMPEKEYYEKEHKEFIFGGLGNAYRYLANYGVEKIKEINIIDTNVISVIKGVLNYYSKSLIYYNTALTSDPDNYVIINNRSNLFLDIYRFKCRIGEIDCKFDYEKYWQEIIAMSPILWEDVLNNKNYRSIDGLLDEAFYTLKDSFKNVERKRETWYYRNYASIRYVLAKRKGEQNEDDFKNEIKKCLKHFIISHDEGVERARKELEEDVDLKTYEGLEDLLNDIISDVKR